MELGFGQAHTEAGPSTEKGKEIIDSKCVSTKKGTLASALDALRKGATGRVMTE